MTIRASTAPVVRYSQQYRHFSASINVFLSSAFIYALGIQITVLFANFYLQALHQEAAFIGVYNAIPSLMTVLLALPVGVLSDRIGPRRAILIGIALQTIGLSVLALSDEPVALLAAVVVQGAATAFLLTNSGPFLMAHTRPAQRNACSVYRRWCPVPPGFWATWPPATCRWSLPSPWASAPRVCLRCAGRSGWRRR